MKHHLNIKAVSPLLMEACKREQQLRKFRLKQLLKKIERVML